MADPMMTPPEMIEALEKRIAEQREDGGDMLFLGKADPLDESMLTYLRTLVGLREATSAASTDAEAAFAKRHPERGALIDRFVSAYRFDTLLDKQRAHEIARAVSGHPPIANPGTALQGPFPGTSPFGEIGRSGSPLAYLIDPGAGSGSDHVTRFWPSRAQLDDITGRGGSITPLYANGHRDMMPSSADVEVLIGRLDASADSASRAWQMLAEAKSLRQTDNPDGLPDLYATLRPEQTVEGQAAAMLRRFLGQQDRHDSAGGE